MERVDGSTYLGIGYIYSVGMSWVYRIEIQNFTHTSENFSLAAFVLVYGTFLSLGRTDQKI